MKKTLALVSAIVWAGSAQASFIYGIAQEGGIWKIDTATGDSTKVTDTLIVNSQGGTNGLAHDGAGTFYYAAGNKFYKNSGTEQQVAVAGFGGPNANATYHNGDYVFVSGSGAIRSIDLGTNTLSGTTAVSGLSNGYGDIASDLSGKVWAQAGTRMQTFDLNNTGAGATTLPNSGTSQLQLGFDANWNLFGIAYGDGKIYSINTATGVRTFTGGIVNYDGTLLHINDAASAVPEPGTMAVLAIGAMSALRRRRAK